ncbi:MAG TPA: hypothetical protein VKT00_01400 [Casimicrobiaceae bacterium]|nr:hypothetical protein [Casimicrobiaceae bacterium]
MLIGPGKRVVLQAAIQRKRPGTPLALLMSQTKDVTVFTDQGLRQA